MSDRKNAQHHFDLSLLANPDAAGEHRDTEWRRLFDTMTPRLQDFFARRVEDGDALDELVARIWQRAVLRIGTVKAADALWNWLVTIGVNLLRDEGRANARRVQRFGRAVPLELADTERTVVERLAGDFVRAERVQEAAQVIRAQVTDDEWELLQLWAVEELTHPEIASLVGLANPAACRKRVSRLRTRLRWQLEALGKEAL